MTISPFFAAVAPHVAPGFESPAWSPYAVGAGIGVLSWFTFFLSRRPLGASSGYATIAGMIGKLLARRHVERLRYFQDNPPQLDWGLALLIGIPLGAWLAAFTGGELTGRWIPPMWEARFGPGGGWGRVLAAFAGGLLMAFGARVAGGCTSGHGISGTLQLSVGSWIAAACFFAGGIAVAFLLYRT